MTTAKEDGNGDSGSDGVVELRDESLAAGHVDLVACVVIDSCTYDESARVANEGGTVAAVVDALTGACAFAGAVVVTRVYSHDA